MSWGNPIIGGGGAIILPAVQSPNYVTAEPYGANKVGVGWSLKKNGNAEFGSVYANAVSNSQNGIQMLPIQTGRVQISFAGPVTSFSQPVLFSQQFINTPLYVGANIDVAPASTANWNTRAISLSVNGFTIFCFGTANSWSNVQVSWFAIGI